MPQVLKKRGGSTQNGKTMQQWYVCLPEERKKDEKNSTEESHQKLAGRIM